MKKLKHMLKKNFPITFEWYKHIKRVHCIHEINQKKKMTIDQHKEWINSQYKKYIGCDMNWDNPTTYTEKMQWTKLHDNDPIRTRCTDKYLVRTWIAEKIGEEYLIPLLGVWDKFEDINFSLLPEKFVLKTNHGSGTNIIVKNKKRLDLKIVRLKINDWLRTDFGYKTLELHYGRIEAKIIAEEYVESKYGELQDYKFLCFNGKPEYCWVDMGRYSEHTRNVYDMNWELQPWNQEIFAHYKEPIPQPENFDEMIEIAAILSNGFPHVRVDLYNVEGKIYFGEMTFTNGGGFDRILPIEYNIKLGEMWDFSKYKVC